MSAGTPTWPGLLGALLDRRDLSSLETTWAMSEIMSGSATDAQIAAFAVALRAKGETPAEIAGLATEMLARAVDLPLPDGLTLVDTCGTGGDRSHTVNISTMAALVVAGTGAMVAKHGNRAASSSSGSADVLEALGIAVDMPPERVAECITSLGIGFCFAPQFHPALRHAGSPRRELGVPTFFNILGPLTNPARPGSQVVGVSDARLAGVMAGVFAKRGSSVLVVRGDDGLDELTTYTTSRVWWVRSGEVTDEVLDPAALGIAVPPAGALVGGDASVNAEAVRSVLAGQPGPVRDAVILNAAAALVSLSPPADDDLMGAMEKAMAAASDSIDSGAAAAKLIAWQTF